MKNITRKLVPLLLTFSILVSACSSTTVSETEAVTSVTDSNITETTIESSNDTESTESTEPTELVEDEYDKFEYEIDYYKVPELTNMVLDQDVIDGAIKVMDAFYNRETSVELDLIRWKVDYIGGLIDVMCPPMRIAMDYDIRNYNSDTGIMPLNYYYDEEETKELFDTFEAKVDMYLSLIGNEDSDVMRALILYYYYTMDATYDYDTFYNLDDYGFQDIVYKESAYKATVENSGICSNLSEGLVFLYTQAGINAIVTSNYSGENGSGEHAWVLAQLDDKYYYLDPTWGIRDDEEFGSVYYFGMTETDRFENGGYTSENNWMWYLTVSDYVDVNDTRFDELHVPSFDCVTDFIPNHKNQTIYIAYDEFSRIIDCNSSTDNVV